MFPSTQLTEDIELAELSDVFCKNQKSFYLYIASFAASNDNENEKDVKPLRLHKVENMIDCIFSPNIHWSFYNAILDTDMCNTIKGYHCNDNDKTMTQILSLASHYKCPIRAQVKLTAIDTQRLFQRYGFIEFPNRHDTFQYIDFSHDNNGSKCLNVSSGIEIYELDDATQEDCRMRKSEWGYVLCSSFGFRNPEICGPFYSDVWERVEVGPNKPVRMFVAIRNNRVVGGCHVSCACGIACLFNVTTLKNERGQGIGTALSLAAMKSAQELNYRYMVLQASDMGSPVYKKLGFKPVPSSKMFVKLSTAAWYFKGIEIPFNMFGVERLQRLLAAMRKLSTSVCTIITVVIVILGIFLAILLR